ncbi:MAG: SDR family oxidoreductase [Novosphingobium sp.]|nr:SDR family oxidoreductase [Novosphingobium sp.]
MESVFGLNRKRILVIGGGQGMGEATVLLLAKLGANVAVLDLDGERAERVATAAREHGCEALALAADVMDEAALVAAIDRADRELGPLDGMATIVGMAGWAPLVEMTTEMWDRDHARNLRYFFVAAREVGKRLLDRGAPGSIVGVASVDAFRGAANHAAYGAAKAGLVNLVKTMAVEWSGRGVRANIVAPGGIVTPRIPCTDPEAERRSMQMLPMQRRGTVDDIAKAVCFFLSEMSPYVTGQALAVDGGFCAAGVFANKPIVKTGETIGVT